MNLSSQFAHDTTPPHNQPMASCSAELRDGVDPVIRPSVNITSIQQTNNVFNIVIHESPQPQATTQREAGILKRLIHLIDELKGVLLAIAGVGLVLMFLLYEWGLWPPK